MPVLLVPVHDDAPRRRPPLVTGGLILLNLAVFALVVRAWLPGGGEEAVADLYQRFGAVPVDVTFWWGALFDRPAWVGAHVGDFLAYAVMPLLTYQFLHAGPAHLAGNLLFLWTFGDNVEDRCGRAGFLAFYLFCGVAAGVTHCVFEPASTLPVVGASGAVSGVMAAYLLFHPRAKVTLLVWIILLVTFVRVPAWVLLVPYFVLQVPDIQNALSLGESSQGVAVWAHLGGAAAGLLVALPLRAVQGGQEPPRSGRRGRKAPGT